MSIFDFPRRPTKRGAYHLEQLRYELALWRAEESGHLFNARRAQAQIERCTRQIKDLGGEPPPSAA